jgi:hypothetical protein
MTPLVKEMVGYTPEAETFMWFDIGKLPTEEMRFLVDGKTLTHIPFHKVIVCCIDSDGDKCMLTLIGGNGSVAAAGFVLSPTSYEMVNAFAYMDTPEGLRLLPATESDAPPFREQCYSVLCTIKHFLDLLGQKAVDVYQPSSKRSLINDKRKAKGKLPLLYDWHTIVIEPSQAKQEHQGGTHASPRRHQARGHWRTYKSGKRGWVKECWRGNASKGTVFKDYELKAKND